MKSSVPTPFLRASAASEGEMGQQGRPFDAGSGGDSSSRKVVTQARILRSAMRHFADEGYERATIATIAEEAGVSRATVFWHFTDKANLFAEVMREFLVPFVSELEKSVARLEDPRDRVLELIGVYEAFVEKNRETIETLVRWVLESPRLRESLQVQLFALHNQFARDVRDALVAALGDEARAAPVAAALMALLDGTLLLSFLDADNHAQQLRRTGLREIVGLLLQPAAVRP